MSDARIQELESEIGDLEDEKGNLYYELGEAEDTASSHRSRLNDIELELSMLQDELLQEPFDEPA